MRVRAKRQLFTKQVSIELKEKRNARSYDEKKLIA